MSAEGTRASAPAYFQEAVTLRLCVESNLDDYAFAQNGGRIIYIMDANVVVFFLNPKSEPRHVRFFSETPLENVAATAIVAAEYLFSRGLAGQSGYPPLLAPSHAEDLWDFCDAILRRSGDAPIRDLSHDTRERLRQLLNRLQRGGIPSQRAAEELLREVPEAAAILSDDLRELNQLLRLSKNDMVRPLSIHPDTTADILSVAHAYSDQVAAWTQRLVHERKFHPPPRGVMRPYTHVGADHRSRRDAEALMQAILLDKAAQEDHRSIRYVLVTADRALFDAYAKWYWTEGDQNKERFILRMPLQYVPILNVTEMPNGIENSDIIHRTALALDTLLAPLRAADPHRYPQSLSFLRILARLASNNDKLQKTMTQFFAGNPFEFARGGTVLFEQIRKEWQQAFDAAVVLNAELIGRRMREDFAPLALLLRTDVDLLEHVQKFQKNAIEQLARAHLAVNARVSIKRLMEEVTPKVAGFRGRAPLIVRSQFHEILSDKSLHEALDDIALHENLELLDVVDHELQTRMNYETWFFAACVAYRCGRWNTALQNASIALDLLEREDFETQRRERDEIVFIIVAATRYALPTGRAITRAFELLVESIATAREQNDQFSLTRALVQRCALVLHLLYRSRFLGGSTAQILEELGLDTLLLNFRDDLTNTDHAYEQIQTTSMTDFQYHREIIQKQVWANVVSADLLAHIARLEHIARPEYEFAARLAPPPSLARRAVDKLSSILQENPFPIISIAELIMVKYYRRMITRREAKRAMSEVRRPPNGISEPLTDLDDAELNYFSGTLEQATNATGGRQFQIDEKARDETDLGVVVC